jgi:tight adherence protein B
LDLLIKILGWKGIIALIGIIVFLFVYKYSVGIFEWVERQTYGTRTYVMEKLELLFIEVTQEKVTYILLGCSVGLGAFYFLLLGAFVSWILGGVVGFIVAYIGFKAPRWVVDYLIERRIKQYQNQMVDALQLLSNGIRAGLSVPQALGMVVDEMPPPVSQEFGVLLQQNRIGVPLEECFENLAKRIPTQDNDMFVGSVNILRETGGNLAEVFDTIIDVIRERIRLQQKIDTYIAQGMFQGITIGLMPFLLGIVYFLQDPTSMSMLFTKPIGWVLLILALGFDLAGFYVIMKIVKIKV